MPRPPSGPETAFFSFKRLEGPTKAPLLVAGCKQRAKFVTVWRTTGNKQCAAAPLGSTVETGDVTFCELLKVSDMRPAGRSNKENNWTLLVFLRCYDHTMTFVVQPAWE